MKRFVLILLVLLAVVAGGGRLAYRHLTHEEVSVATPTRGLAVQAVYATGTVEPGVMLPIAGRNSGRLMALHADEGDSVTKNQVLANLEDDTLQANLNELRAKAEFAKTEYDRQKSIFDRGFGTRQNADRARADWDAASAAVTSATAAASYMQLVSPADGTIIRRDGEIGEIISANEPVFWLSCCEPLRITAEVDEEDISLVKPGQKVLIRADAFPEQVFNGLVKSITPKGDPVARSYRVRLSLDDQTVMPMMIGMTAETNIIVSETPDALLIPASAVQGDKVWLVENGRLAERLVKVGARGTDQTAILQGLDETAQVVVNPGPELKTGQPVRVTKDSGVKAKDRKKF